VGKKYGIRQSSVKWVLVKTLRRLRTQEFKEPEVWFNHLSLTLLLFNNLDLRIFNES